MALQSKKRIPNDEGVSNGNEDANGHGDPERNLPPDHGEGNRIGPNPHILSLPQLHLPAIAANGIPSHTEKGKKEELDRYRLDKRSCPEPGKDKKEKGENGKPDLF